LTMLLYEDEALTDLLMVDEEVQINDYIYVSIELDSTDPQFYVQVMPRSLA